jgi:all-trans-retinol 13,14-reductase
MYMTPPSENQGDYADTLLVHCSMSYDEVRPWANTLTGNRGPAYEAWKKERVERVIARLEQIHPGLTEKIEAVYAASPLSIRDWYHTKEGALYGYRKDSDNLLFSQLSVRTKVKNLLLTGQNINLHGMCGVPLTSILTAEALLGQNTLIHQINHLCSTDFISPH